MKGKVTIELFDVVGKLLTKKEVIIITYLLNGKTVTDIAKLTNRDVRTISTQKNNAYKKLGVKNDISLLATLLENSYVAISLLE